MSGKEGDDLIAGPYDSDGAMIRGREELKRSFRSVCGRGANDDGARRLRCVEFVIRLLLAVSSSESTSISEASGSEENPTSESRSLCCYENMT